MFVRLVAIATVSAVLVGCGSDDGGFGEGYCAGSFADGTSAWSCTSCSGLDPLDEKDDFAVAIDNDGYSYRSFSIGNGGGEVTISATAPDDTTFPAGADAGALMRFPEGLYGSIGVRFNAYNDGVPVEGPTGGETMIGGSVQDAGSDAYYAVAPILEFDRIDAVVSVSGNAEAAEFRVYEFCGDR